MGDSRISVTILLDVETPHKTVVSMPADSPLSELVAHVKDELKLLGTTGMCSTHQASIHTQHTDCEGDSDTRFTCTFGPDNDNDNVSNLLAMYDCTLHPPKDVTSQVIQYDQPMGPNSITLQSLQWFPSAKLFIILRGDEGAMKKILESDIHVHEDFQYNLPTSLNVNDKNDNDNDALAPNTKNSRLVGGQKLLPSEMFQAVENRFDQDDETMMNADIDDVKKPRKIQKKRRTEKERWALLDDRLKKLDEKTNSNSNSNSSNRKKSAKVSAQVKKMLIKSRAEGDKKTIRQEDRFYLETIVMYANHNPDDDSGDDESSSSLTSSYRFFSRSSNVGKIISSATRGLSLGKNQLVEVLVKTIDTGLGMDTDADAAMGIINMDKKDSGDFCYRRLPNTMMIYDAESRSYLSNFDRVIIRIYDSHADGSENTTTTTTTTTCTPLIGSSSTTTTLLSEEKDIPRSCMDQDDEIMTDDTDQAGTRIDSHPNSHVEREIYEKIHRAIEEMDSKDNKTSKKKKKTAATEKVRQILLKGKAKGDKKIPVKDRFYLEVISITLSFESQSTNVFLSKYDSMRAVSMSVSNVDAFEILKSQTNNDDDDDDSKNFTKIQDDLRIKDAEDRGIIQQFDRIIVREITNTSSKES